jgi:hypothetical protein
MGQNNGNAEKYNPKGTAVHTSHKGGKQGHGAVMAGKAVVRKGKKQKRS